MLSQNLIALIEEQQKGHENEPLFMVGEQLKEIAEREPVCAEIIENDLAIEGMSLAKAADALKAYADKNHGKAKCFCITPIVAEGILREFYGLPTPDSAAKTEQKEQTVERLDLSSFL